MKTKSSYNNVQILNIAKCTLYFCGVDTRTVLIYDINIESVLRYLFLHFNVCPIDYTTVTVSGMVRLIRR